MPTTVPPLPPNWTVEVQDEDRLVLCKRAESGEPMEFVSIDWGWRRFEVGYNHQGFMSNRPANPYEGRGWRAALFADALLACQGPAL